MLLAVAIGMEDQSALRILERTTKSGMPMTAFLSPWKYPALQSISSTARANDELAFTPDEMRHNFAVRALEKRRLFRPRRYIYLCVRCKQMFMINGPRGAIVAVDRNHMPLPEPLNSRQVRAFSSGPCPGFERAGRPRRPKLSVVGVRKLASRLFNRLPTFGKEPSRPFESNPNENALPTILSAQDLLF